MHFKHGMRSLVFVFVNFLAMFFVITSASGQRRRGKWKGGYQGGKGGCYGWDGGWYPRRASSYGYHEDG